MLCILHHWGVQLILTCSWARPAILAAGKGRGGMFLFLLFFHCHSFSFLLYPSLSSPLLSLFSLSLGDDTKWPTRVDVSLNPNTINQKNRLPVAFNLMSTHNLCRPRWLSWMRRPTGDQEVAGSTPAEVGNILSWRLIMKYFLRSFSPFRWFKKGSCQFLAKECAQYWLTA